MDKQAQNIKICERCKVEFACQPENITACQCYGITLADEAKKYISNSYDDCLCRNCLLLISAGSTEPGA